MIYKSNYIALDVNIDLCGYESNVWLPTTYFALAGKSMKLNRIDANCIVQHVKGK